MPGEPAARGQVCRAGLYRECGAVTQSFGGPERGLCSASSGGRLWHRAALRRASVARLYRAPLSAACGASRCTASSRRGGMPPRHSPLTEKGPSVGDEAGLCRGAALIRAAERGGRQGVCVRPLLRGGANQAGGGGGGACARRMLLAAAARKQAHIKTGRGAPGGDYQRARACAGAGARAAGPGLFAAFP